MGQYQSGDKTVQFTDGDTLQLASDLYQLVEQEYHGSKSVEAVRLEEIVKHLHAGMPMNEFEWDILADLKDRYGTQLEKWRASGRDGQDAMVPSGTGRISESQVVFLPSLMARIKGSPRGRH